MSAALDVLRVTNSVLGPIAPNTAGWAAQRLFTTPRRHRPPARERQAERNGERVRFGEGLSALRFGWGGGPRVLALHGWEGRATQWGALARALTAAGFELIAIEAPGHGQSPGRRANPRLFMDALFAAEREFGPFSAVVGHSMGAAAVAGALGAGLQAERGVLIAGPASPVRVAKNFAKFIGLPRTARERFLMHLERSVGVPPEALELSELELELPMLLLHSRDDAVVKSDNSEELAGAWPNAELRLLDGLGHNRVLRSEQTVRATVDFITGFGAHAQPRADSPAT